MRRLTWRALALVGIIALARSADPGGIGRAPDVVGQDSESKPTSKYLRKEGQGWLDTASREAVRTAYLNLIAPGKLQPMDWTGDVVAGDPGDTSADYKDAVLRAVSFYRAMSGVPGVTLDAQFSRKAQRAALMMSANRRLSHNPSSSWLHFSSEGAEAAARSNICYQYGSSIFVPGCIDRYIEDEGTSNYDVGHRRWILYPQTTRMGTGDVERTQSGATVYPYANALWVLDGNYGKTRPATRDGFVAWPPPGYVPYQMIYPRWSFSYPGANFSGASVTMRDQSGTSIPLALEPIVPGYGENTIVWVPANALPAWPISADTPLQVSVAGVAIDGKQKSFDYTVIAFDPALTFSTDESLDPSDRLGAFNGSRWLLDSDGSGSPDHNLAFGLSNAIPVHGDWNGDGREDVGVFANGTWALDFNGNRLWEGPTADRRFQLGWTGVTPVVGDWNGDGRDTIGIFIDGFWFLDVNGDGQWDSSGKDRQAVLGWSGVTPLVGDWDGSGRDKVGIYTDGFWFLDVDGNGSWSGPTLDEAAHFGWLGTTPLVGDWNGNGRANIGIYVNGFWFLDMDGGGVWDGPTVDRQADFGFQGAVPTTGDWTGSGRAGIGVFQDGHWYLDLNNDLTWNGSSYDRVYAFGEPGDTPIASNW